MHSSASCLIFWGVSCCLRRFPAARGRVLRGPVVGSFLAPRPLSTCNPLCAKRRKFTPHPDGVPSWANYDGNQKVIDGDKGETTRLIWEGYKRNHKGGKPPQRTRKMCIRAHKVCSNPCPICARQLTVDYKEVKLLSQFICPHTNEILPASRTGLCRLQQKKLEKAIEEARDYGLLPIIVPRKIPAEELRTPPWNKIDVRQVS